MIYESETDYSNYVFIYVNVRACVRVSGVRAETGSRTAGSQGYEKEGVRGLKALGVRELSYRLAFLACHVAPTNPRVRSRLHGESPRGPVTGFNRAALCV